VAFALYARSGFVSGGGAVRTRKVVRDIRPADFCSWEHRQRPHVEAPFRGGGMLLGAANDLRASPKSRPFAVEFAHSRESLHRCWAGARLHRFAYSKRSTARGRSLF